MGNLACTYCDQGRWDDAQRLEERVLELREKLLGQEHPDTVTAMANLAWTYSDQGRWDDAQRLEERVLELREKLLGQEHPDTVTAMANLARTYSDQGRWDDAQRLEERVLELREKLLGQEHPDTVKVCKDPFVDITVQMAPRYELGQGICKVLYESADQLYKELDMLNNSSFALGLDIAPSLDLNANQLFSGNIQVDQ